MTDQEINKTIAEACGWKEVEPWLNGDRCFELNQSVCGYRIEDLPDYCNCLNAMHEAEKVLTREQIDVFCERLNPRDYGVWWGIHATARQRAEAFLKTIGDWKE
jgi:hypothetical protein